MMLQFLSQHNFCAVNSRTATKAAFLSWARCLVAVFDFSHKFAQERTRPKILVPTLHPSSKGFIKRLEISCDSRISISTKQTSRRCVQSGFFVKSEDDVKFCLIVAQLRRPQVPRISPRRRASDSVPETNIKFLAGKQIIRLSL